MALDKVSTAEIKGRAAKSAEQDQTARTCRLVLLYTLRQINQCKDKGQSIDLKPGTGVF